MDPSRQPAAHYHSSILVTSTLRPLRRPLLLLLLLLLRLLLLRLSLSLRFNFWEIIRCPVGARVQRLEAIFLEFGDLAQLCANVRQLIGAKMTIFVYLY